MLDEQDGEAAAAVELGEDGYHAIGFGRAHSCHDLVEQQELRVGGESPRHFQTLAVGERQRRCDLRALAEEIELLEHIVRVSPRGAEIRPMQHRTDHHIVLDGKPEKRPDQLEGAADPAPADLVRPTAIDPCTVETDAAAVRRDHARNHVEQRRLPRAVWTDDCKDRSLPDAKAHVVNGKEAAKSLADPLHLEEVVHAL